MADETNTNPAPINPEPPKRSWFDVWHIIAYVIIIAMIGAVYYAVKAYPKEIADNLSGPNQVINHNPSPTPTSTSDWKTYTNASFGFSFQYPDEKGLNAATINKAKLISNGYGYALIQYNGSEGLYMKVDVIPQPFVFEHTSPATKIYTTLDEAIAHYEFGPADLQGRFKSTIGNVPISEKTTDGHVSAYALYDSILYDIEISSFKDKGLAQTMFSTFKFTDSVASKPSITNTSGAVIKGKAGANYMVWAYAAGQSCLTRNTHATYGASKADVSGNFTITIPTSAATGKSNLVVVAFPADSPYAKSGTGGVDTCFPAANISDPVSFTVSR